MIPVKRWRLNMVSLKCHLYEEGGGRKRMPWMKTEQAYDAISLQITPETRSER